MFIRIFLAMAFCLSFGLAAPVAAQISNTQSVGAISATSGTATGALCQPRFVEGFDLEAELQRLEAPRIDNVLKILTGFLYLQSYVIECQEPDGQNRWEGDREPTTTQQQPKRKCITTPDSQTICYTIKGPNTVDVEYCDDKGNCKKVTITQNPDGTMNISNPNATIKMECSLDSLGRTHCRVAAVSVTGGGLTKLLYNDLVAMIKSIKTKSDPNNNTTEVCIDKDGDKICYTVTPTEVEMCVTKPDGSTECAEEEHEEDVQDLIDWLD